MGTSLQVAVMLLALGLGSDSLVDDSEGTTLPISPTGNLPVMQGAPGDAYGFTDAGVLWSPAPQEHSVQELDGGSAWTTVDAGPMPAPCAPIAARIAHRRAFIDALEQASNTHGPENGPVLYCQRHPAEGECQRAPTSVERDLDELIQNDPSEPAPEADGWIIRWSHELARCRTRELARRPPKRQH